MCFPVSLAKFLTKHLRSTASKFLHPPCYITHKQNSVKLITTML